MYHLHNTQNKKRLLSSWKLHFLKFKSIMKYFFLILRIRNSILSGLNICQVQKVNYKKKFEAKSWIYN